MIHDDDKAGSGKSRKERVLHTRVPAVLDAELKRLASSLRVPVSNVVRTILEDAVNTVDAVGRAAEDELRGVADRLKRKRTGKPVEKPTATSDSSPQPPLAGVIGFQDLLMARDDECSLCGTELERGTQAFLGIRDSAGPRLLVCPDCLPFSHRSRDDKE